MGFDVRDAQSIAVMELGALSGGLDAFGIADAPRLTVSRRPGLTFMQTISELRDELATLPEHGRDPFLYGRCLHYIREPVEAALKSRNLSWDDFESRSARAWMKFIDDMPTRRVDLHLMREFARNPQLKLQQSDLNDWVYLGVAASYCDVVFAERQFADWVGPSCRTLKPSCERRGISTSHSCRSPS